MQGTRGAWTISRLAELAGAALADDPVRVNGRVRELPNERLIRWYTTIGLLDPPLARRGRTALYGPRHLLQLVAVKRRQAAGLAIAQIQAELTGATDDMLREVARLPASIPAGETGAARAAAAATAEAAADGEVAADGAKAAADHAAAADDDARRPRPRDRFWAEPPADADRPARPTAGRAGRDHAAVVHAAADEATPTIADATAAAATTGQDAVTTRAAATVVPGIRLAAGVTLLLDGGARPIAADDLVAIEAAARPLLDELGRRGLHPMRADSAADSGPCPSPEPGPEPGPESTEPVQPTSPGRRST